MVIQLPACRNRMLQATALFKNMQRPLKNIVTHHRIHLGRASTNLNHVPSQTTRFIRQLLRRSKFRA